MLDTSFEALKQYPYLSRRQSGRYFVKDKGLEFELQGFRLDIWYAVAHVALGTVFCPWLKLGFWQVYRELTVAEI